MKNISIQLKSLLVVFMFTLISGCNEDEPFIPIGINFTASELGISSSNSSLEVSLTLSRAAEQDGTLSFSLTSNDLIYGQDADYYTTPALESGQILVSYVQGDEDITLTVHQGDELNIQEDKTLLITALEGNEDLTIGDNNSIEITFSENFISEDGIIELDAGGEEFPNQAYLDLSKLNQTSVDKYSWDLGFYNESGNFEVVLNNSAYVMARSLDKTNLDEVTAADTLGFSTTMVVSNYYDSEASGWIDDQSGDLDQTAIGSISSTESENKVFIIKRDGVDRNWKKIRILQNGDGYTLQYADIDETTYTSVNIDKNDTHHFSSFDLDNGLQTTIPEKSSWDIMYGTYAGKANYGAILAIGYKDFIVLNRNASAVQITESEYDDFSSEDLSSISLVNDNISVIGSSWRTLVDFTLQLNPGVFYIIKDGDDNHYKLKFNRLKSLNEERGYPEISFELLK